MTSSMRLSEEGEFISSSVRSLRYQSGCSHLLAKRPWELGAKSCRASLDGQTADAVMIDLSEGLMERFDAASGGEDRVQSLHCLTMYWTGVSSAE